ncbi:MAG: 1-acyl-sn-glycerol-3-phosphate acyltransferase [Myxococcales bacterium]|nr:1-acyl-sn-glycerol-3-phosphate acyltransferase [Myxococcales bacterium]
MLRAATSIVFWAFLIASSILLFPIALGIWLVTLPFDPRRRVLHQFTCFWGSLYTWLNPAWPVTIVGREKIDPGATYVMVANHQSLLDILVLFRLFTHFKWVSKVENFRIPFIGWNMRLNRYVQIQRGKKKSVLQMMKECRQDLEAGSSIMMFPEGTRSLDGKLRPFRTGAFELAQRTERPLLPIVLNGTCEVLPKRGFVLRGRHPIRVEILDEIPFESFRRESAEAFAARVRESIEKHLERPARI